MRSACRYINCGCCCSFFCRGPLTRSRKRERSQYFQSGPKKMCRKKKEKDVSLITWFKQQRRNWKVHLTNQIAKLDRQRSRNNFGYQTERRITYLCLSIMERNKSTEKIILRGNNNKEKIQPSANRSKKTLAELLKLI